MLVIFIVIIIQGLFNKTYAKDKAIFLSNSTLWADSILASLSVEERIAQLFMVAAYSNKNELHMNKITRLVKEYKIGGVMFLKGGPVRQAMFTNHLQQNSQTPLMIAIDAEWGVAMRLDSAMRFPWQMTLGAIEDTTLICELRKKNEIFLVI